MTHLLALPWRPQRQLMASDARQSINRGRAASWGHDLVHGWRAGLTSATLRRCLIVTL